MNLSKLSQRYQENLAWAEVFEAEHGIPISVHTDEYILDVSHCSESLPFVEPGDAVVILFCAEHAMVLHKICDMEGHQPFSLPIIQNDIIRYQHTDSELAFAPDGKITIQTPKLKMRMDADGNLLIQGKDVEISAKENIQFHCKTLNIETL